MKMKNKEFGFILLMSVCVNFCLTKDVSAQGVPTARVPILLYHHIQEVSGHAKGALCRWSLSPQKFANQMDWIAEEGFAVITMAQLNDHLRHNTPLPAHPIILTFDDGWKDHYSVVMPILAKHHFSATFFITTDSVGHTDFVTWDELKKMAQAGMDIQAHSLTHPKLNQLTEQQAYREISESKKVLESHLGKRVFIFAYPFGRYTQKIIELVKSAGYESATVVSGNNIGYLYRADRSYTLSRIAVEGDATLQGLSQSIKQMKENHVEY